MEVHILPIPNEIIDSLCAGSDRQVDKKLKLRLQALKGREDDGVKEEVLQIIGDCINYSLCSGFVLTVLQTVIYVDICGGNIDEAVGKIKSVPVPVPVKWWKWWK
jgi:hypothetical protein